MTITKDMRYNGKVVATVKTVKKDGINYRVSFTNGYEVVVPASMMAAEVLEMA